jgi:hypothetical protein
MNQMSNKNFYFGFVGFVMSDFTISMNSASN